MGKELTCTSITALHLVHDEHRTICMAEALQRTHEIVGRNMYASAALNTFYNDSSHTAFSQFFLYQVQVAHIHKGHLMTAVVGRADRRIIRYGYGTRSATVKTLAESYYTIAAGVERGQF